MGDNNNSKLETQKCEKVQEKINIKNVKLYK